MIDLSKSIRTLLEGTVERAHFQQSTGHMTDAADAWDDAARLALKLAELSKTSQDRRRRLETADEFHQQAKRLRDNPRSNPNASSTASAVTEDVAADSLDAQVRALIHRSSVDWQQIAGLEETKRVIQTAYALSLAKSPEGVELKPARSLLLFGPPGCGKTLLAAAASNSLDATFFSVQVGSLLSKWFGESSRLISALFQSARREAPSVVFFDEIDALARQRHGSDSHAGRQMLGNLLSELDGIATKGPSPYVLTIAATNAPWDLDPAILSRFARKVLIPLPDDAARTQILQLQLSRRGYHCDFLVEDLVAATRGMTGRELEQLAEFLIERMVWEENPDLAAMANQGRKALQSYQIAIRPLTRRDVDDALSFFQPRTSPELLRRYAAWQRHTDQH